MIVILDPFTLPHGIREASPPPAVLRWNQGGFSCRPTRTLFTPAPAPQQNNRKSSGSLSGDSPTHSATAGVQSADVCVCVCVPIRVTCARGTAVASHSVTSRLAWVAVPPLCPAVFLFIASSWPSSHTARHSSARWGFPPRHPFWMVAVVAVGPSC